MPHGAMLTIHAMVRVGPWLLETVEKDDDWSHCERCDEPIKEIWTCTVDAGWERLVALDGNAPGGSARRADLHFSRYLTTPGRKLPVPSGAALSWRFGFKRPEVFRAEPRRSRTARG